MLEIERTFLVRKLPLDLSKYRSEKVKQGYIVTTGSVLRVRSKGNNFELTKKKKLNPNDHRVAHEHTMELTKEEFDRIWTLVDKFLEKTRYFVPLENGLVAELDVFGGKLKGHCVVEVEFSDEKQMEDFAEPDWFGRDISQEDIGHSGFLAGRSFTKIKELLE